MAVILANAGISLGAVAKYRDTGTGNSISKSAAWTITAAGQSLPTEKSLRVFLGACKIPGDEVAKWCDALSLLQSGANRPKNSEKKQNEASLPVPDGVMWEELKGLSLFKRMRMQNFAGSFPGLRKLLELAMETLNDVRETRPAYTLHGVEHAVAVVRRLGELLGPSVEQLSRNETRLLILGAFFHDVGRVQTESATPSDGRIKKYIEQADRSSFVFDPDLTELPGNVFEDYRSWDRTRRLRDYLTGVPSD